MDFFNCRYNHAGISVMSFKHLISFEGDKKDYNCLFFHFISCHMRRMFLSSASWPGMLCFIRSRSFFPLSCHSFIHVSWTYVKQPANYLWYIRRVVLPITTSSSRVTTRLPPSRIWLGGWTLPGLQGCGRIGQTSRCFIVCSSPHSHVVSPSSLDPHFCIRDLHRPHKHWFLVSSFTQSEAHLFLQVFHVMPYAIVPLCRHHDLVSGMKFNINNQRWPTLNCNTLLEHMTTLKYNLSSN